MQSRSVNLLVPIAIPLRKHCIDLIKQRACPRAVWVAVVGERRHFARKVRPADLPQRGIPPVVGSMPIRAEDACVARANQTKRARLRLRVSRKTVATVLTATQSQAFLSASFQLVSSALMTFCCCCTLASVS